MMEQTAIKERTPLREIAIMAANNGKAEREKRQRENEESRALERIDWIKALILRNLKIPEDLITIAGDVVSVEGIEFGLRRDPAGGDRHLVMSGWCLNCGNQTASQDIGDIEDLGRMLIEFTPTYNHRCEPDIPVLPTVRSLPSIADQVDEAYYILAHRRMELEEASNALATAKANREYAEAEAWKDGLVVGSNEQQRKAWLKEYLTTESALLEQAEATRRQVEVEFDLARYEVQRLGMIMRASSEVD
jgi:hypothetical protein